MNVMNLADFQFIFFYPSLFIWPLKCLPDIFERLHTSLLSNDVELTLCVFSFSEEDCIPIVGSQIEREILIAPVFFSAKKEDIVVPVEATRAKRR